LNTAFIPKSNEQKENTKKCSKTHFRLIFKLIVKLFTSISDPHNIGFKSSSYLTALSLQDKKKERVNFWFYQGGWILATSLCVLAWVYTWDSLLIKDIKRLWPIHTVQISNMQYAFGVKVYEEVCILNFTQFSQNSLLTKKFCSVKDCKRTSSCENGKLHTIKE